MRILGVKNLMAKILVFTLFIYFYAGAERIRSEVEDAGDENEASPAEAEYENRLQGDNRTGMTKMVEFFNKMETALEKLNQKFDGLERMGNERHQELKTLITSDIIPRISALEAEGPRRFQRVETLVSLLWDTNSELQEEHFAHFITPQRHYVEFTDCGGTLELARGIPSIIRYANPGNSKGCVWTILTQAKFDSYRIKFQSLGLDTEVVGMTINYWDSSPKLKSQKVTEFGPWISISSPYVLITFCPNPSKASSGFEASILGLGTSEDAANFKPSWVGNSTETSELLLSENFVDCIATQTPSIKSTDCGGLLEVARGVPSAIHYSNLGNNEGCAWSINPKVTFPSYRIKFQSLGTEAGAPRVIVYFGNSIEDLQPQQITEFGFWISIPASFLFITFYSDPSKVSSGFEASILGFGISSGAANFNKPSWFGNSMQTLGFLAPEGFVDRIASLTSTDCGGILNVARGVPSTIRYPRTGNYEDGDRCAWTVNPEFKFAVYRIKVQSFGMPDQFNCTGVKIYFWSENAELQSLRVTDFGSWIDIPATYVLITFCSLDGGGGGFGASIVGVGASPDSSTFRPFWSTNRSESFSYPPDTSSPELNNEMVAVVVQPPQVESTTVSVRVTQIGNDTIKLYELQCHHCSSPDYQLSQRSNRGRSSSATHRYSLLGFHPLLVIFKSNANKSGAGFTISYKYK